ncbi:hypothetical protein NLG97_g9984 [Lecanicillium saksenae]|uniref:Uncharacterized protein n=1 Tax=Lecanicillium saksenae TaxID=468837 RepID=A0ACC1QIE8_9HYPO|nr:hypothetical protein NLG97_g9984 [Lecanicillium saksenae]
MASEAPETAERLPTVHEYGQRALKDTSTDGPSEPVPAAGPSQPTSVSPATTEATPAVPRAQPVSPEQPPAQPDAQRNVAFTNGANPEQQQQQQQHIQQQPDHVYAPEGPRAIDAWPRRHVILLALVTVLSVVGLGLSANWLSDRGFYLQDVEDALALVALPVYIVTIFFVIAETAVRAVLKYDKGFHPAVHTAFWLVCWMVYAALVILYSISISGEYGYDSDTHLIAQFVFIILLLITTFGLFIIGCIDTAAYNSQRSGPPPVDNIGQVNPDYHADRSWGMTKLVFNGLVIVFGIIGFSLGLSMLQFPSYRGDNVLFPACACALLLPIIWAIADSWYSLTGSRRQFFRGITPGAHVGLWLVSWIAIAIISGALTTLAVVTVAECGDYPDNYLRRSVPVEYDVMRHVRIGDSVAVPIQVRQAQGASQTNPLPTPTSSPPGANTFPTSTSIIMGIPKSTPTTTSRPFGSGPTDPDYDPLDDPDYDPSDDPDDDPLYPHYTRTSTSYRSYPTSNLNGGYDDGDDYPYNHYPYNNDPWEEDTRELCARKSYKGIMIATVVFMWFVFLFCFILFVGGCSDTHLHNLQRDYRGIVYVPVVASGLVPSQYAYAPQMPMQVAGQPPMAQQPMAKQPMAQQHMAHPPMQQVQPPPGNVVEYYGTAQ